jgi:hypothetical protein
MIITYHGDDSFKIQSGKLTLVSNPQPRFRGDITILTKKNDFNEKWPPTENTLYGPGEYELNEVEIRGMPSNNGVAIYIVTMDEMKLCFLGSASEIDSDILEKLGEIDILFAPANISLKTIKQIDPKVVIPSYNKPDALKVFLKEADQEAATQDKLTTKKKELPDKLTVVALKP